jgi:hypothetical protein
VNWTPVNTDQLIAIALTLPFCVLLGWFMSYPRTILGKLLVALVTSSVSIVILYFLLSITVGD